MESAGDCENIRMKRLFKRITALASAAALTLSLAACGGSAVSGPKNTAPTNAKPVTITVWTYYNGDQLETFSKLVDEFNATVGKEQNITVEASSQGSVNDLETNVLAAAEGKVGAAEMPNIFSAYADTCYAVDQMGLVADLSGYLTDEEKAAFPESYLTEGDFDDNGTIKIFPVAKSTELLFLNDTDWQAFAAATGATYEDLSTMEGLVATAGKYYDWTDARTAAPDGSPGRRQGAVWPRRHGKLHAHWCQGSGQHHLYRGKRQDDREPDRGCGPEAVGQLLCPLCQGLVCGRGPFPQ